MRVNRNKRPGSFRRGKKILGAHGAIKRIDEGKSPGRVRGTITSLRVGDPVMVLVGGNTKTQKLLKGQTGKILRFLKKKDRVVVEGLNMIVRHKRAQSATDSGGKISKEGSVHISNVMYYVEELKRPVRMKYKTLEDGRKVRGYVNPATKKFEQIDFK